MLESFADEIRTFLACQPEVKSCRLYGSLSNGNADEYSDVDIEIDVSGNDNGAFMLKLQEIFSQEYKVIFSDYAPSLAPEKYIVTIAVNETNPFRLVDISCTAIPHCGSVLRQELSARNNLYDHTLRLFSANLKHYLRGVDCTRDIQKMYGRIFKDDKEANGLVLQKEAGMLNAVYQWLRENAGEQHEIYVAAFEEYLKKVI